MVSLFSWFGCQHQAVRDDVTLHLDVNYSATRKAFQGEVRLVNNRETSIYLSDTIFSKNADDILCGIERYAEVTLDFSDVNEYIEELSFRSHSSHIILDFFPLGRHHRMVDDFQGDIMDAINANIIEILPGQSRPFNFYIPYEFMPYTVTGCVVYAVLNQPCNTNKPTGFSTDFADSHVCPYDHAHTSECWPDRVERVRSNKVFINIPQEPENERLERH